jgi:hypothetical protein
MLISANPKVDFSLAEVESTLKEYSEGKAALFVAEEGGRYRLKT